ncbi:Oidioi.mRNA.OKI2018_I69.PAR.g9877.t1.cds [Oikopleura dioica]|uniref:Oidioi.mRNA.OKI2018_I69.PAR.g9877.t1.cds n=1 Tax=Oikopleura dioica TaxID=34765 RepID=A0ABN7RVE9_OIKDI|nr:Oidioi.mRNA.OKI2018_I69.PAR.g9877.t1.cds [Oikopleura dioica]
MIEIKNYGELEKLIEKEEVVIGVCLADWSRLCRNIKKELPEIAKKYENIKFAAINDNAYDIRKKYSIASFPTWLIFKNSKLISEISTSSEHILQSRISAVL